MRASDHEADRSNALRRPLRGEIPVLLTLPLRIERRPRRRRQRTRRVLLVALLLLGATLLAAGFWPPV